MIARHLLGNGSRHWRAIEKWERDISRFEAATGKIAEETKTFSLRQLVPDELDLLITSNSNTLKTYEQVKAYVNEQVALGRDKKGQRTCADGRPC